MDDQEPRSQARLAASIVLLVVIGASLIGAVYLGTKPTPAANSSASQSATSATSMGGADSTSSGTGTASSNQTPGSASTEDTRLGLKLGLRVSSNATGALSISSNATNLLDKVNNVTTADDWPYPDTGSYPCGNFNQFPVEYAVLQGHYGASNYTSAGAFTLYDTGEVYPCPTSIAPLPYLLFAPLGDNVTFIFSSGQKGGYLVSASYSVTGYWTGSGTTASFHQFPPGTYTVLVEDEWGNVVLLPFTVRDNTISISGLSLCSSSCGAYPAPYASALVTIDASVPVSTLEVYVNNTYDGLALQNPSTTTIACSTSAGQTCSVELGGSGYSNATYTTMTKYYATCSALANSNSCSATYTGSVNTVTRFADLYKGSVPSSLIPVVLGDAYVFKFVATFQDGSTATATVSTVAT
jgi:hypothetical protein